MTINFSWQAIASTVLACALASCSTTKADFYRNPTVVTKAALCRTFIDTRDQGYLIDLTAELTRRGINPLECHQMVQQQNQAAAAIVGLAIIGTAVAVCANNDCGVPYYPSRTYRGNCQYEWEYDSRGRRCGRRAASYRAGGW